MSRVTPESEYKRHIWWSHHHRFGLAGEGHADVIAAHLDLRNPEKLLDVGSGFEGYRLKNLVRHCRRLVVAEIAAVLLKEARRGASISRIDYLCADACSLPLHHGSMNAITALGLFAHIEDPEPVFAEFHRVSRPGALLFVTNAVRHPIDHFVQLGLSAGFSLEERHEGAYCPAASGEVKARYLLVFRHG